MYFNAKSLNAIKAYRLASVLFPAGDVVLTLMRRHNVASTSVRRHINVVCPLACDLVYYHYALCMYFCLCHALLVFCAWNEDEKHWCLVLINHFVLVLVLPFMDKRLWTKNSTAVSARSTAIIDCYC